MKNLHLFTSVAILSLAGVMYASQEEVDLIDVQTVNPHISVGLYFAMPTNILGKAFYDGSARAYLRSAPAHALASVQEELEKVGLGLLVLDAYRPLSVQKDMWAVCQDPRLVIDPAIGSRHNYGNAVDVLLINIADGSIACMPTKYFAVPACRDYATCYCTTEAKRNCKLLELTMEKHGFQGLATEWWHFDFGPKERYQILDVSFQELATR